MTPRDLDLAMPTARAARRLALRVGAVAILALAAIGCSSSAAPTPTPDPFAGLSEQSNQAYQQGLDAFSNGQYDQALASFQQARLLSPNADPRIDDMIQRTRAAMAPTPTPAPPTPTPAPATPTAVPATMSTATPDTNLSQSYFGTVTLAVVPGSADAQPIAASQFYYQDQLGLRIDGLKQHLRLPFVLRVFDTTSGQLLGQVESTDPAAANTTATPAPTMSAAGFPTATAGTAAANASTSPSPTPTAIHLVRFWDSYVWYHAGGEAPGSYRAELWANGTLANTFDYTVVDTPVANPSPTQDTTTDAAPTAAPEAVPSFPAPASPPTLAPAPVPPPAPAAPRPAVAPQPQVVVPARKPVAPSPAPAATPVPTVATAQSASIGGVPSGLEIAAGKVFVTDADGTLRSADAALDTVDAPVALGRPAVDVAIDASTGHVFVSAAGQPAILVLDQTGHQLSSIALPAAPADLQLDPDLGLLYVCLPDHSALGVVDVRAGHLLRTVDQLPAVTGLALDATHHTLYAAHTTGQVSVIDAATSQVTARVPLTSMGLSDVSAAHGWVLAVNSTTHELGIYDPATGQLSQVSLQDTPLAVTASDSSGAIYVLTTTPAIVEINPDDGTELGRVNLPDQPDLSDASTPTVPDLKPRLVVDPATDAVYATLPTSTTLSLASADSFS